MDDRNTIFVTDHADGVASIDLAGEWDIATVPELILALESHASAQDLRVDLTDVTFIDSTTLSALLKAQRRRQVANQSTITLILPDDSPIQRIFEITGIGRSFAVLQRAENGPPDTPSR